MALPITPEQCPRARIRIGSAEDRQIYNAIHCTILNTNNAERDSNFITRMKNNEVTDEEIKQFLIDTKYSAVGVEGRWFKLQMTLVDGCKLFERRTIEHTPEICFGVEITGATCCYLDGVKHGNERWNIGPEGYNNIFYERHWNNGELHEEWYYQYDIIDNVHDVNRSSERHHDPDTGEMTEWSISEWRDNDLVQIHI